MSSIPPDIYERVHEFALAIANASLANDDALHESLCESFRAYFDEQTMAGRSHPFLTEAMADFSNDSKESVRLYELSLAQANECDGEPRHTKMISLGEALIELGQKEQAEAYLRDGRTEAVRAGDEHWIDEAERLLITLREQ